MPGLTALDCLLRGARAIRVSDIVRPTEPAILTDLTMPADPNRLRRAMAVSSVPDGICMCLGDIRFEFLDSNRSTAVPAAFGGIAPRILALSSNRGVTPLERGRRRRSALAPALLPPTELDSVQRPAIRISAVA